MGDTGSNHFVIPDSFDFQDKIIISDFNIESSEDQKSQNFEKEKVKEERILTIVILTTGKKTRLERINNRLKKLRTDFQPGYFHDFIVEYRYGIIKDDPLVIASLYEYHQKSWKVYAPEVAKFLSHISIFQEADDKKWSYLLIVEDDAIFIDDFLNKLVEMIKSCQEIESEDNIAFLLTHFITDKKNTDSINSHMRQITPKVLGSCGYYLTSPVIIKLLNMTKDLVSFIQEIRDDNRLSIDYLLTKVIKYFVDPFLIIEECYDTQVHPKYWLKNHLVYNKSYGIDSFIKVEKELGHQVIVQTLTSI